MFNCLSCFADDYAGARVKFRTACKRAGAQVSRLENPRQGPAGEDLATDYAVFGSPDAGRFVVVISGTHGLEGLCGSACQTGWIETCRYECLPDDVAVLHIHALNPYGVAWLQRETEEGVDLNRNFIDHNGEYPNRPLYAEIHDALLCKEREGAGFEAAQAVLRAFRDEHGQMGYIGALLGGQYDYPNGMSFGGHEPVWSNRTLASILRQCCAGAAGVAVLDYHTGLGPYGHASIIVHDLPDSESARRMRAWYGPSVWPVGSADPGAGNFIAETGKGCRTALPDVAVSPVTIEFGTFDMDREIEVMQHDLWLRNHGELDSDIGREIKAAIAEYFYPRDRYWRELVFFRSQQVILQAVEGLASNGH
jgi:hypothetical protein